MSVFDDVLAGNRDYSERFALAGVPGRAGRGLAVVTCMDSRIDPLPVLGLAPGDAKVLRNAGGRVTDDVLTTLVLAAYVLDVTRVLVMPHTDCRMTKVTDDEVHAQLLELGVDTRSLAFGTIADQVDRLRRDVQRLRSSPYLPAGLPVAGALYDVRTGLVDVVVPHEG